MTPEMLKAHLEQLELDTKSAGALLGVHARTVSKWLCGEREMPLAAAAILVLLAEDLLIRSDYDCAVAGIKREAELAAEGKPSERFFPQ